MPVCRDSARLLSAFLFLPIYIPHLLIYILSKRIRYYLDQDIMRTGTDYINISKVCGLLYLIHTNRYFRSVFYYRIGPFASFFISWWRPGDKYFIISQTTRIGEGIKISHPYSTIINAKYIGKNFSCRHLTTLGNKCDNENDNRPIIGDNVTLGANVTIIGGVKVGDNVTIGAGAVVVKDIPDNAIAVGNPARVIRYKEDNNI